MHFIKKKRKKKEKKLVFRGCGTIRFAKHRRNIVGTLFRMVTTLFQHCNAVLR